MKQVVQDMSSGSISVQEVPPPARAPGSLLVATAYSLISAGTERTLVELGAKTLLGKARARPDLVRKTIDTARTEGLATAYDKVRGGLGAPRPLGYSLAGRVLEGDPHSPIGAGDLVACGGADSAVHAEVVTVPRRLCARVPSGVDPQDAAYATVAAIALHGVRTARTGLGDVVAVVGLGLVGQLTLELAAAAGAVPLGLDPDASRVELAREAGFFATSDAAELSAEGRRLTGGAGADGVVVAAGGGTAEPLEPAVEAARDRATVCVIGDVAIEASRHALYAKELSLVVSRSYGAGRYDESYERDGNDYPRSYVRWTEERNLAEAVRLMSTGALRPSRLTTHVFDVAESVKAYGLLASQEPSLGILLRYPSRERAGPATVSLSGKRRAKRARLRIGAVGAGSFARGVLLPQFARRTEIAAVATTTGLTARAAAEHFGARRATTDVAELIEDDDLDALVIASRHDSHAAYAAAALRTGKHVFVEKPLAVDEEGLTQVEAALTDSDAVLMVGFNRRFAPLTVALRDALGGRGPLAVVCRVNAGRVPPDHWTRHPRLGGGRFVGEGCHFVDLACALCGSLPVDVTARAVSGGSEPAEENVAATLQLTDGSVAVILYAALGDPGLSKERIEVLGEGGAATLDDFRELRVHAGGRERVTRSRRDKGHAAEVEAFVEACRTGRAPWPAADMAAVTRATFAVRDRIAAA